MLSGLFHTPEANRCLPFVRLWYTTASEYVWHDANGNQHTITQAEGGEQGDPLMPALFSLGQEPALQAVQAQLQPGEVIYAFLNDIYAVVQPERVRAVYDLLARHLEAHARIRLNQGKTRIWNRGGHAPPNIHTLGPDTWVGNRELPPEQQGITVLGAPIGTDAYAQHFLQNTSTSHRPLLEQLPHLQDLQAAWLLLLYTASPRSNYLLRLLPPAQTATFAEQHDLDISRCLTQLLQTDSLPVDGLARAHLPLAMGGLGLMSASQLSTPAHWASWADAMPVLQRQLPSVAATILQALNNLDEAQPCIQAAQAAHQHIHAHGWEPPSWQQVLGQQPPQTQAEAFTGPTQPGWQHHASASFHRTARAGVYNSIDAASQALLDSQTGPFASRAFTTIPYTTDTTYPDHIFRILLLRRLRLPLPLRLVGAAAILTHLATTERPVPGRGCCEAEGYHWNRQLRGCAGKLVHVSPCTQDSATSTSLLCNASMTAPSSSSQMDSLCGTPAPLRQATITTLTARWSALLTHASVHAFAASLLNTRDTNCNNGDGALPPLGHLLAQTPVGTATPSRLPGR